MRFRGEVSTFPVGRAWEGARVGVRSKSKSKRHPGPVLEPLGGPASFALTLVEDEYAVVRHPITRLQIAMGIIEGLDLDDVRLADLGQKIGDHLVEMIFADLDTVRMANAFGAQNDAFVSGGF